MSNYDSDVEIIMESEPYSDEVLIISESPEEQAERKKEKGNELFKAKRYLDAATLYSGAIELCPNFAAYYGNRGACYLMLGKYKEALEDAKKSVLLDDQFLKGYIRIAKASIALGDLQTATSALSKASEIEPKNAIVLQELSNVKSVRRIQDEAQIAMEKKDYRKVVYCMDRALEIAVGCARFLVLKAECLAYLHRYQEAQEIANDVLRKDGLNADAVLVRGMCLYYQDNVDKAFAHFQHVLKLAPDHQKAKDIYKKAKQLKQKKQEGNEAFRLGRMQEACDLYTEALKIDPNNANTNSKLYFNRATVIAKLGKLQESASDCKMALHLDENYSKARWRLAKTLLELEEFEEAVREYEKIHKTDKSKESKRLLQEAKLALRKSKRVDYYKVLGVDKNASVEDIKKAYRKRALVHHPDRHANASEVEKKEQEKKFKEVGEAYGILSDARKRARYDSGQDLDETEGFATDIDPNFVFHSFFGGGPSTAFNFNSGGYPGFTFQFG